LQIARIFGPLADWLQVFYVFKGDATKGFVANQTPGLDIFNLETILGTFLHHLRQFVEQFWRRRGCGGHAQEVEKSDF
jgi:hypothetical protein